MCRGLLVVASVLFIASCASTSTVSRLDDRSVLTEPPVEITGMSAPGFEPPILVQAPQPRYPLDAQLRGESGTVRLRAIVATNGALASVQVAGKSDLLVEAVREAAATAHFEPARLGGVPIEVWVTIPITFTLPAPSPQALTTGNSIHIVEHLMPSAAGEPPNRVPGAIDKGSRR
jgi:TonB family protein